MIKIIEDETRIIISIFNIKIKFQKSKYAKKRLAHPYYFYKKNKIDITSIPPATGQIRDIQLANLSLLIELDKLCKQNNLTYWLDFGTLLGAIRHKGFIPWDDDIDIGMARCDYEKLILNFEKIKRDDNLYLDFHVNKNKGGILKLRHKKTKNIFVDIFPYDNFNQILTKKEQNKKSIELKKLRKKKKFNYSKPNKEVMEEIYKFQKEIIPDSNIKNPDIIWGFEYGQNFKNHIHSYNIIYPIKTIEFEGRIFPCMNCPNDYLEDVYGKFMEYPKKISLGHTMYAELTEDEAEFIKNYAK